MASKRLVVKAILQYPEGLELGCSPDIRRFQLPKESGADDKRDLYRRLVDALCNTFPEIVGVSYSMYWKDAEGDLVQFSTTAELQSAIDASPDHVLRIYIIVHLDDLEETTEGETEGTSDAEKSSQKRVRFARAGRRFRRKIRRRRRTALSDSTVISKEYRTAARVLIRRLHKTGKDGDVQVPQHADTSLAAVAPEIRQFIQEIHEDWHSKLPTQRPIIVARRMRMKQRTLPEGLKRDHFQWLLRLMGRWHRRHAGLCRAMSGWSSGETDADESGGEETMLRTARRRRRMRQRREAAKGQSPAKGGGGGAGQEEEEEEGGVSSDHRVAREFRQAVRLLMRQIHRKNTKPADDQEKATLAALKPEIHSFILKVAEDWHAMLAEKKPTRVTKRMKKRRKGLPADLQRDYYLWLCRYFKRWHLRHSSHCSMMAGWSSGEEDDPSSDYEEVTEAKGKKGGSSSSSDSDSDDGKKKKEKKAVPKEFVKAARLLVNRLHHRKPAPATDPPGSEEKTVLAGMSPETQAFVQAFAEEWDQKLTGKSPMLVAKRMKKKKRTLPPGMQEAHVDFLCRFLSRWHGKHAAFCQSMGAWSSGETGGETSGDERSAMKGRARRAGLLEVSTASEQEDTDCVETSCKPVSKDFRVGVRQWMSQQHKKPADGSKKQGKQPQAKDDKDKVTLPPEVQQFLQRFAEEWHSKVVASRPRTVSREMKSQEGGVTLPSRMGHEEYNWLCCFMARWHRKHPAKCDVISDGEMAAQG